MNNRTRIILTVLVVVAFFTLALSLYWKQQNSRQTENTNSQNQETNSELRSKNFQLEVQDTSPAVQ